MPEHFHELPSNHNYQQQNQRTVDHPRQQQASKPQTQPGNIVRNQVDFGSLVIGENKAREHPFNLKGGGGMLFFFEVKIIIFFAAQQKIIFYKTNF